MTDHDQLVAAIRANKPMMDEVRAGRKISAIKCVRQTYGSGLKEAKDAIEEIMHGPMECGTTDPHARHTWQKWDQNWFCHGITAADKPADGTDKYEVLSPLDLERILVAVANQAKTFEQASKMFFDKGDWVNGLLAVVAHDQAADLHNRLVDLQGSSLAKIPF